MRRFAVPLLAFALLLPLAALLGCSDSDDTITGPPAPPVLPPTSFKDLSEKAHVIDNLVLAYTQRNLAELDSLLDDGLVFYFAAEDVANSGLPSSWDRTAEMIASNGILAGVAGPDSIVSIDLDIPYDTLHWDTSIIFGPGGIDTLYVTTVSYSFNFKTAGDITYTASGMEAIFSVRLDPSRGHWRLVRWDDLGSGARAAGASSASAVEELTWGRVKELYNPQPKLGDLSEREDVINNLVVSYLRRDVDEFKRILDPDNYRFFFSDGDVVRGLPPGGWDRAQDEAATANLLDPYSTAPNRIVSLDLSVMQSNLIWVEIVAPPPFTEIWYVATTNYAFTFKTANDISYITSGAPRTQFTVRNTGTEQSPRWRLVQWRDLGDGSLNLVSSSAVEESSWGRVKSYYAD